MMEPTELLTLAFRAKPTWTELELEAIRDRTRSDPAEWRTALGDYERQEVARPDGARFVQYAVPGYGAGPLSRDQVEQLLNLLRSA